MTVPFSLVDFAVLGSCLGAMLAVGVWLARRHAGHDPLSADRALRCWPLGPSLAVASTAAICYLTLPTEAYWAGLKLLVVPAALWATLPILFWCVVPLCFRLELESVHEYLELRFDLTARTTVAGLFFLWQILWLAGMLALPCALLFPGGGLNASTLTILLAAGGIATAYTCLDGIRAVVWNNAVQLGLMAIGLLLVIAAVWSTLDNPARIWEVADSLGRNQIVDTSLDWSERWSIWAALPCFFILPLFFHMADQATVQRLLVADDDTEMKRSLVVGYIILSLMVPMLMYVGMGMLAVYHDNAREELRPNWIVNGEIDAETGEPLIGPETVIDAETLPGLIERRAILDPNTDRPMTDSSEIVDHQGRINIDRLATRELTGERRLRRGRGELFSRFVRRHLPIGLAGFVLAGLVAAAMATIDSGICAMLTVFVIDFHRRLGWGERWLAQRQGKQPDQLDTVDELQLTRLLAPAVGVAIVGLAMLVLQFGNVLEILIAVLNVFAGPLLAVFLLGLFARRATAPAALTALALGMATAAWLTLGCFAPDCPLWPWTSNLGLFWPLPLSLTATVLAGYILSFLLGRPKNADELTGLVAGLGPWGILLETEPEEPPESEDIVWIDDEPEDKPDSPWR